MESEPHSGRPSISRNEEVIDKVRKKVLEDRSLRLLEIATYVEYAWAWLIPGMGNIRPAGRVRPLKGF